MLCVSCTAYCTCTDLWPHALSSLKIREIIWKSDVTVQTQLCTALKQYIPNNLWLTDVHVTHFFRNSILSFLFWTCYSVTIAIFCDVMPYELGQMYRVLEEPTGIFIKQVSFMPKMRLTLTLIPCIFILYVQANKCTIITFDSSYMFRRMYVIIREPSFECPAELH
jgi:hypothetical protein